MKTHDQQRRIVLRNAVATGCALLLPALLVGCGDDESPQTPKQSGGDSSAPATTPTTPGATSESQGGSSGAKVSKEQAQYQDQPKDEQSCQKCLHFIAESNTCKLVDGQISPSGWCTFWVQKG
ncbi:hypothetical protein [Sedimenticola hydrogenitrophicus]|uniref:hypothetical protein n=1 Tax=Sedimenticola hydrogenitrophicus TaxID=2967975 RepID=UPI0021A8E7D3|nr:hypothetical protein [Sedimenticola hydrogenitrophicus]